MNSGATPLSDVDTRLLTKAMRALPIDDNPAARWECRTETNTHNSNIKQFDQKRASRISAQVVLKTHHPKDSVSILDAAQATRLRDEIESSLTRASTMTPALQERLSDSCVRIPTVLATDPSELKEVQIFLCGSHPPRKALSTRFTRDRRRAALEMYNHFGILIRAIEALPTGGSKPDDPLDRIASLAEALGACRPRVRACFGLRHGNHSGVSKRLPVRASFQSRRPRS